MPMIMGWLANRNLSGKGTLSTHLRIGSWQWDGPLVVVRNCRLGFSPLFYYATDKEYGVAPKVDRLLECGAPSELDDTELAVFLRAVDAPTGKGCSRFYTVE